MTAATAPALSVPAPTAGAPILALAGREARRMLLHPAYPVALILVALWVAQWAAAEPPSGRRPAAVTYIALEWGISFLLAPATIIVANRVARSTVRGPLRGQFDSAPLTLRQRTLALCTGLLLGPTAVALAGAVLALAISDEATVTGPAPSGGLVGRGAAALIQLPILTLGAGLLGILLARWLPYPGTLPLLLIVLLAVCQPGPGSYWYQDPAWLKPYHVWLAHDGQGVPELPAIRETWHALYLLGLCALAFLTALWRTPGPRRGLATAGLAVLAVTAVAAFAQLP